MSRPYVNKFTLRGLKRLYELWPVVTISAGDIVLIASSTAWQMNTRDITVNKRRKPINERVDLLNPKSLKLAVIQYPPRPVPELHSIYQTMDAEHARRARELEAIRKTKKKRS
ncbi:uncharacterized protein LOC124372674 [Homalodisca vitripennis]|uniref:Uncharacterized protein n=1 Tax=Homalodisca liturata TaxID=320908 RepID=A0A1B6K7G6_9HEMI|nr:uncharacterized protein LOC124372674 [Homalodisca vitripennis]